MAVHKKIAEREVALLALEKELSEEIESHEKNVADVDKRRRKPFAPGSKMYSGSLKRVERLRKKVWKAAIAKDKEWKKRGPRVDEEILKVWEAAIANDSE
jgi:hypothetical protein